MRRSDTHERDHAYDIWKTIEREGEGQRGRRNQEEEMAQNRELIRKRQE